jgi:hypothetical protein
MLERERKIAIRLLITGSGVRVPHNPLTSVEVIELNEFFTVIPGDNQSMGYFFFTYPLGHLVPDFTYFVVLPFTHLEESSFLSKTNASSE